jgi:hypothetical protein
VNKRRLQCGAVPLELAKGASFSVLSFYSSYLRSHVFRSGY